MGVYKALCGAISPAPRQYSSCISSYSCLHPSSPRPTSTNTSRVRQLRSTPVSILQPLRLRSYLKMAVPASESEASMRSRHNSPVKVILSYVLDWSVLLIVGIVSAILGNIEPRKRPFSLSDPNISYVPFSSLFLSPSGR